MLSGHRLRLGIIEVLALCLVRRIQTFLMQYMRSTLAIGLPSLLAVSSLVGIGRLVVVFVRFRQLLLFLSSLHLVVCVALALI